MSLLNKASLIQIPSGYKDGTLYSAKPTNGDGDFTFSRGSNLAATRVNSEGLIEKGRENLTLYSQDFDNASWTKLNATVTANNTTAPDGTNTADLITSTSTNETGVYYFPSVTGINTWSIYAKKGTGRYLLLNTNTPTIATKFDLQDGVIVGTPSTGVIPSIQDVGDGWYRCSITSSTSTNRFTIFITDNTTTNDFGSSIGLTLSIWGAQLEQGLVATDYIETTTTTAQAGILEDMPRLDYSGGATCPSLLLEPQRTNVITQSEYFGSSDWSKAQSSATSNATNSPEGLLNASLVVPNTNNAIHSISTNIGISSGTHTLSVFAKQGGYKNLLVWFDTHSGGVGVNLDDLSVFRDQNNDGYKIESFANDWVKISVTCTISTSVVVNFYIYDNSATPNITHAGDGTSGVYLYGAQCESGSYVSSYIPTYGASVTRGADSCTLLNTSNIIGQTEGTLFFDADFNIPDSYNISLSDSSASNYISIDTTSGKAVFARVQSGGATQATINTSGSYFENGERLKCAIAYKANDFAFYINGTQIGTDTSGSVPATDDIRFARFNGSLAAYQNINQVTLFNTRLSNDELASLTTL